MHEQSVNECNAVTTSWTDRIENSSKYSVTASRAVKLTAMEKTMGENLQHMAGSIYKAIYDKKTLLANNEAFISYPKSFRGKAFDIFEHLPFPETSLRDRQKMASIGKVTYLCVNVCVCVCVCVCVRVLH